MTTKNMGDHLTQFPLKPISIDYGMRRGGPIDRYYISSFINRHLVTCSGAFLEFGSPTYKYCVRPDAINSWDVLDIDCSNPWASLCGDVEQLSSFCTNFYDAIICTQVLQYTKHPDLAVHEMYERLSPGGILLITCPFIAREDDPKEDRWRFSRSALALLLRHYSEVEIETGGNLSACTAFLSGYGLGDITDQQQLDIPDSRHYVVTMASVRRPPERK